MLDSGCLKNANEDQNSLSEQLLQGCIFYLSIHHKMQQIPEKLKWDSKKVEDLYEIYLLKKFRPWQDSNLQSSDQKSGALSIRPHGLSHLSEVYD